MENQSIISHVSLGTNDYQNAIKFYDSVLLPLGIKKIMEVEGATAYGKAFPELWIQTPANGEKAEKANGIHVAFLVDSPRQVDEFYKLALEAGATDDGAPGPREAYGTGYYGAFVRDLDGHKIEAMHWDESK